MKINKIIICIITIITIMSFSTSYGATKKEPASNAKAKEIVEYLEGNKKTAKQLTSTVSISKLSNWYKTLSKKSTTKNNMFATMIKNALADKSKSEINTFVNSKNKSELKNFEPKEVFSQWEDKIEKSSKKDTITAIIASEKNAVINPMIDQDSYSVTAGQAKSDELPKIVEPILGTINAIGIAVAVGVLVWIGIKYMIGSVEDKSQYKKDMLPYLVGAVILFAGSTIPNVIYKAVK